MTRYYHSILALLLVTTMACSGGGGGGGGAPAGGSGSDVATGGGTVGGDGTLAPGSTKLPDGSTQLSDGTIKKPDGTLIDTNGVVKKPDGTVAFPEGTVTLTDGTMKLPNGAIVNKDGTIVSAPPKAPDLKLPGSTIGDAGAGGSGGGDTKVEAVIPTASISGVTDGQLLGTLSATTVSAADSKDAVSYLWTLDGPGLADDKKTSTESSFAVKLPEVTGTTAVPYTLSLQVKSKTGHTAERKMTLNAMPKPVLVIENGAGLSDGGAWPVNTGAAFTPGDVQYNPVLSWSVTKDGNAVNFAKGVLLPELGGKEQIVFKPETAGAYVVTLKGTNGSGESTKTFTLNAKDIPTSVITGVAQNQKVGNGVELSAAQSTAGVSYAWKLFKAGETTPFLTATTATWKPQPGPGTYTATLQVTDDAINKSGNLASVDFEVVPPPTAVISGVENNKVYAVGEAITLQSKDSKDATLNDYTWAIEVTGSGGSPVSKTDTSPSVTLVPSETTSYKATLTVTTIGGSDSATVEFSAVNKAVGKIAGITPGYSYRKALLPVTASGSTDATAYSWVLKYVKGYQTVTVGSYDTAELEVQPPEYAAYTLDLVAKNTLGNADPVSVAFNVRASDTMQMMPMTVEQNTAIFALNDQDIYVGGANGLYHFGADHQPVRVAAEPIYAIWAVSSNNVFASTSKGMFRYSPDGGWKSVNNTGTETLAAFAGGIGSYPLYGVTTTGTIKQSDDGGNTWDTPNLGSANFIQTTPDGKVVVMVRATGEVENSVGQGWYPEYKDIVGVSPIGLYVQSETEVYVATDDGRVWRSDVAPKMQTFVQLPQVTFNAQPVQELVKTMWMEKSDGPLYAITQLGHVYSVDVAQKSATAVSSADLAVATAAVAGTTRVAVDSNGKPYQLVSDQWKALTPVGDDVKKVEAYDFEGMGMAGIRTGSRVVGDSIFLINFVSAKNSIPSAMQYIKADGSRVVVPEPDFVLDLWGSSEQNVYVLVKSGKGDVKIVHYDGTALKDFLSGTLPDSTEVISAIRGVGESLKYLATDKGIYEIQDDGALKVLWHSDNAVNIRTLYTEPRAPLYAGTGDGKIITIAAHGTASVFDTQGGAVHQILGGMDGPVYATTDSKLFQTGSEGWGAITLPDTAAGFKPHHIAIVSPFEVYFAGDNGLVQVKDGLASYINTKKYAFMAHSGQFTYYGVVENLADIEVTLTKFGPMQ